MNRHPLTLAITAVLLAAGCNGSSSSGTVRASLPSPSATSPETTGMVRVPQTGNSWIGSIIPRLHRAGLRVTIPTAWSLTSSDGPGAEIESPVSGTRVPRGTVVTIRMTNILGSQGWTPGQYVVPGVLGETLELAAKHIETSGLPWSVQATALPPTATGDLYASYCVTAQNPAGGTEQAVAASGAGQTWGVALSAQPC
jgi:beta-lactam-binding protein with PASTA domain